MAERRESPALAIARAALRMSICASAFTWFSFTFLSIRRQHRFQSKQQLAYLACYFTPGIGGVELGFRQFRSKILGGLGMAAQQTFDIASLAPSLISSIRICDWLITA